MKTETKAAATVPGTGAHKPDCHSKCILDGELIVSTDGKPDFYQLQKRTLATNPFKIELASSRHPAAFVAYDILYVNGKQLTETPLTGGVLYLKSGVSFNCIHFVLMI